MQLVEDVFESLCPIGIQSYLTRIPTDEDTQNIKKKFQYSRRAIPKRRCLPVFPALRSFQCAEILQGFRDIAQLFAEMGEILQVQNLLFIDRIHLPVCK